MSEYSLSIFSKHVQLFLFYDILKFAQILIATCGKLFDDILKFHMKMPAGLLAASNGPHSLMMVNL